MQTISQKLCVEGIWVLLNRCAPLAFHRLLLLQYIPLFPLQQLKRGMGSCFEHSFQCIICLTLSVSLLQAMLDIVGLYGLVVGTMYSWYPVNKTATALMLPYLAWLTLATCLTYCIWRDNPEKGKKKE